MLSRFPRGQRFTERLGDLDAETSPRRVIQESPSFGVSFIRPHALDMAIWSSSRGSRLCSWHPRTGSRALGQRRSGLPASRTSSIGLSPIDRFRAGTIVGGSLRSCRRGPDHVREALHRGVTLLGCDVPRLRGRRLPEQVALPERDTELGHGRAFRLRLDAFGNDLAARLGRKVDKPNDDGAPARIRVDPVHETGVDLHEVGPELDKVIEVCDPGAGVIGRESNPGAESEHRGAQRRIRLDRLVLGDLEDNRAGPVSQQAPEGAALDEERWRDVEAEPRSGREAARFTQRRIQGRRLELDRHPALDRAREPKVRPTPVVEPRERLKPDSRPGGEVDDRLKDGPESG